MPEETVPVATSETSATPPESAPESVSTTAAPAEPSAAPETPAEPPARKTFRDWLTEDPHRNAEYQKEIARIKKRWERQQMSQRADAVLQSEDAVAALDTLKDARPLLDDADEDDTSIPPYQQKGWQEKQARVTEALRSDRFWAKPERVTAAARVLAEKRPEADGLWAKDPEAYHDWLQDQVIEHIAAERTRKAVPAVAQAMATEQVAAQMQNVPVPVTGTGAGAMTDAVKIELYANGKLNLSRAELKRLGVVAY